VLDRQNASRWGQKRSEIWRCASSTLGIHSSDRHVLGANSGSTYKERKHELYLTLHSRRPHPRRKAGWPAYSLQWIQHGCGWLTSKHVNRLLRALEHKSLKSGVLSDFFHQLTVPGKFSAQSRWFKDQLLCFEPRKKCLNYLANLATQ
jgi:hypothetical protein